MQNVGYRAWTQAAATRLGIRGWVKNESDGSVTACLAGAQKPVSELIEQCRKGPPLSDVSDVTQRPASSTDVEGHDRFTIRR